ncbi:hypothetical protein PYK79_53815 [Streptomyces sp. ID05-04B]|uniref:hypothetical protein n=1 Tax=unclassified Streptomyces TaxID=2593676 RepID=UPI000D19BE4C|nr:MULTISPECIES: hypothetical protein [unclassified Streptomyces]AVV46450.1 hypothetical protein C6376_38935 [Streptomyces sp. P3]AVV46509.1 hypothetical protein C6376_39235 [Streptomyces sp. P3]MDX5570392.1 hypothetical protein [Streptomyces sp. ID05-04B]
MSNGEQDYGAWRAEQHRRAQAHAFGWAERAHTEYGQAIRHEDDARARQNADSAWQRDRMAEERRQAQFHGVRSTEALKLAEMWARVARAMADGYLPEPVFAVGGQLLDERTR